MGATSSPPAWLPCAASGPRRVPLYNHATSSSSSTSVTAGTTRGPPPDTDIVGRLRVFIAARRTSPGPACTKAAQPAQPTRRCPGCAPLFPIFPRAGAPRKAASFPAAISGMILKGLKVAGANTADFSGACARLGCLSTATEAGVREAILWLQSGHAQSRSSRSYMKLTRPDLLFATWAAFRL